VKLRVGLRVVDKGGSRWQVVSFDKAEVAIRRMFYKATMDGRGPMAWTCPSEAEGGDSPTVWLRGNFNVVFTADKEQP
jgi:hypothetical protein